MVNCNPETVSTDYDTSDRLYFEPLTCEDVLEVVHAERQAGPIAGVIVQLGGQTPLRLAQALKDAGVPIVGTSPEAIHLAEERGAFGAGAGRGEPAGPQARAGPVLRRGQDHRRRDRLPGAGPALVRARRPGHGDRLRREDPVLLHRAGHRGVPGAPGAGRPVPRRRGGDRRRRALRRHRPLPRRRDGAHRGGRHPLRRLGLRAAADHPGGRGGRPDPGFDRGDRRRGGRSRLDQHPVRAGRRHLVRARGQPAGLAYGAVRLQGDRHPAGQGGGPGDAGLDRSPSCGSRACCGRPGTARGRTVPGRSRSRRR